MENDENNNLIDDREEASIGMDAARDFDFERAVQLMTVIEKCANVGVKATSISGLAQAALNEMNEEAKGIAKERAAAFAKAEAKASAQRAEKQRQLAAEAEAEDNSPRAIPSSTPARENPPRRPVQHQQADFDPSRQPMPGDANARRL